MGDLGPGPAPTRVLLVEDDPRIASFMTKGLRAKGYEVEWVTTGAAGIARLEAGGVDVHLLDLGLPDMDGLEVLRILRERGIDVPVIISTARTDHRDRDLAAALGAARYLTKPFALADLFRAVQDCAGG